MSNIRVGDWVKLTDWSKFYEVVEVEKSHIKLLNNWGEKCSYSLDEYEFTIRDNPTPSPVREVVTKELVDGVYGRVELTTAKENKDVNPVFIRLLSRSQKAWEGELGFNAKELRELAKTLNEVAELLEGE